MPPISGAVPARELGGVFGATVIKTGNEFRRKPRERTPCC